MNFYSCEKQIFKSFHCTKIRKDSRIVFPYNVHNQADFDNPFISGRDFIYLQISKMSFTEVFTRIQCSKSIKAATKATI